MAIKQVISEIKQKINNNGSIEYVSYKLGPELKYISSLFNSNNNNLEEMLLLGTDKIIEKQTDENNNQIKVTNFRKEDDNDNYYILIEIDYAEGQADINVNGSTLDLRTVMVADGTSAYQVDNINFVYNEGSLYLSPDVFMAEKNLKYKKQDQEIDIANKRIFQTYITDGNIRKEILKEQITSYI